MKKLISVIVAAMMILTLTASALAAPVIGINQYGEHGSLDNCREGFIQGLLDAGLAPERVEAYCSAAGAPILTRTHGRREVAFLNRAWDDVMAADLLVDRSEQRQPLLNSAVNSRPCRCAGFASTDTPQAFLERCFSEHQDGMIR